MGKNNHERSASVYIGDTLFLDLKKNPISIVLDGNKLTICSYQHGGAYIKDNDTQRAVGPGNSYTIVFENLGLALEVVSERE